MKVLFLHLSDLHIQTNDQISNFQIQRIVKTLNQHGSFTHIILIFSGDLSNSGDFNECKCVKSFIGNLVTEIRRKYNLPVSVLMCPGNHDIVLPDGETAEKFEEIYKSRMAETEVFNELTKQKDIWFLYNFNKCFIDDKLFCRIHIPIGNSDFLIEANIINSSPFSLKSVNDKGFHYLPRQYIDKFKEPTRANLSITILHHSIEYFHDSIKNDLEKAIMNRSSLVFYGHEHSPSTRNVFSTSNSIIMRGGALDVIDEYKPSKYLVSLLDCNKNTIKINTMSWDDSQQLYMPISSIEEMKVPTKSLINDLPEIQSSYTNSIKIDNKTNCINDIRDNYVFPRIQEHKDFLRADATKPMEFTSFAAFLKLLEQKKKILLIGDSNSGKTLLLKMLIMHFTNQKCVVYINAEDLPGKWKKDIIQRSFEHMYGHEKGKYEQFEQLDPVNRILLIDNIHLLKNIDGQDLIADFEEQFEFIILTSKDKIELDVIKRAKNAHEEEFPYQKYRILPFFSDKRKELISRTIKVLNKSYCSTEELIGRIEDTLKYLNVYFCQDPYFIVQYINYYCTNIQDLQNPDDNAFSKVFEANITYSLLPNLRRLSVNKAYILLGMIAYHVHFSRTLFMSMANEHRSSLKLLLKLKVTANRMLRN